MKVTVLIDNYDSFTWNVYQLLCEAGASVQVVRNDQITIEQLRAMKPANIVISPGPGHPRDAGISCNVIREFQGKVPILGVCLGEQAIFEVFGGQVVHVGEIVHGKTRDIKHDEKGLFMGIPQDIKVTRYHSLAGSSPTLPSCLEISATCKDQNGESVIMAIRHKEFTIEGVQFHPESCISENGLEMITNFLQLSHGTWKDEIFGTQQSKLNNGSIMTKIAKSRFKDLEEEQTEPGKSISHMREYLDSCSDVFPVKSTYQILSNNEDTMKIMAEVKRASPSKGIFDIDANAVTIARSYTNGGASVISVLTEPRWFHGSLNDLQMVRKSLKKEEDTRPALLCKDFIMSEYHIKQARLNGADLVLLIVALFIDDNAKLSYLFKHVYELGMEALVEVNNEEEMQIALELGSKIIGVNNRNLTTFNVDMSTTARLSSMISKWNSRKDFDCRVLLVALSGIQTAEDVKMFRQVGACAVLVGESLMKSPDPAQKIREILN